jgi:hypothetical protein
MPARLIIVKPARLSKSPRLIDHHSHLTLHGFSTVDLLSFNAEIPGMRCRGLAVTVLLREKVETSTIIKEEP